MTKDRDRKKRQKQLDMVSQLRSRRGAINRLVLILLILVIIMLIVVSIPLSKAFRYRSEKIGCDQAMKSAGDGLIIEYLNRQGDEEDLLQARDTLAQVMPARENLCPAGGNVYLYKNAHGIYEPICGLHYDDAALRTRLNASYGLNLLRDARNELIRENAGKNSSGKDSDKKDSKKDSTKSNKSKKDTTDGANEEAATASDASDNSDASSNSDDSASSSGYEPESVDITLNGKKLTCVHVTEEEMIHRGTATTNGYKGTVAFYGVAGDFTFSAKTAKKGYGDVKAGEICYFVYADKDYCAIWRSNDDWTGDAYDQEALSGTTEGKSRTGYGTYYDEE